MKTVIFSIFTLSFLFLISWNNAYSLYYGPIPSKDWDSITVNQATNKIYASSTITPNLQIMDGSSNALIGTISLPSYPAKIVANPTTNKIYVLPEHSFDVIVMDGSSDTITKKIHVPVVVPQRFPPPDSFAGIHLNPLTNTIYVATGYYNSLVVINGTSDTIYKTIGVGGTDFAIDYSSNMIYTSGSDSPGLIINASSNKVIGPATTVIMGRAAIDPHTHKIYESTDALGSVAINEKSDTIHLKSIDVKAISVINGTSNITISTIPITNAYSMDVNPDTNKLYINSDDKIQVFDTVSNKLISTIPMNMTVPEFPFAIPVFLASIISLIVFYKIKFR